MLRYARIGLAIKHLIISGSIAVIIYYILQLAKEIQRL